MILPKTGRFQEEMPVRADTWSPSLRSLPTHTHTHTHIYIYIYIEREREREIPCSVRGLAGVLTEWWAKPLSANFFRGRKDYVNDYA